MSKITARALTASVAAVAILAAAAPASHAQFGSSGAPALTVSIKAVPPVAAASAPAATSVSGAQVQNVTLESPSPTGTYAAVLQRIFDLTNAYRVANGAPAVKYNAELATIAQNWSNSQASVGVMSHNPNLRTLYPAGWTAFAENVLQNWTSATAEQLVQQWIDSPPHRAAMISPAYTDLGLGYAASPDGKVYATQNYARF